MVIKKFKVNKLSVFYFFIVFFIFKNKIQNFNFENKIGNFNLNKNKNILKKKLKFFLLIIFIIKPGF